MATSFGIHVGNTSACLAVSKDGKTDVVAAPTGDRTTPAMVSFTDSEIIVGLAAQQGRLRNITNTVTNNKRWLTGAAEQADIEASPVTVVEENGQLLYQVDFQEKEFKTSPKEVLAHIYRYLHSIADTHCKEVEHSNCVLTVPLDYTTEDRALVASIAAEVGFKVVQCISEPAAACLAYGLGQLDQAEEEHVLVYRAGGLTSDLTVVRVAGGCYTVLESVFLEGCGGHKVTDTLVKFLAGEFKQKYQEELGGKGRAKLAAQAETVKHILSTLDTAHCYVESLYDGMDFSSNVTRARFDNQLSPVLSDLLAPIEALLEKVGLTEDDITKVVLVGGTAKVTKLQTALANMFDEADVLNTLPPDEVLAYGAAVQASYCTKEMGQGLGEKVLSIGQDLVVKVKGGDEMPLLAAGTPVPVKRSITLKALGESTTVEVVWGTATLASLSLDSPAQAKLHLSLHVHRDGASLATLQDKVSGASTTMSLVYASQG